MQQQRDEGAGRDVWHAEQKVLYEAIAGGSTRAACIACENISRPCLSLKALMTEAERNRKERKGPASSTQDTERQRRQQQALALSRRGC